jgi:hypothetical protein
LRVEIIQGEGEMEVLFDEFSELGYFFVVIFPVKNFPLPTSFFDGFFLGLDFFDGFLVDQVVKFELVLDAPHDI